MNAIVAQIQRRWAAAFARAEADALASLYIEGALFFGSMPDLYCGRSGVRQYFETLAKGYEGAAFADTHTVEISPDLIVSAGFVTFTGERDGERFSTLPDELDAGAERGAVANREPPRLAEKLGLTASSAVSAGNPTTSRHVLADDVRGVTATARHEK
jgi:ketosteroid isomerase-like protein